jgi:hypothetical protein
MVANFVKIGAVKNIPYLGRKCNYPIVFYIFARFGQNSVWEISTKIYGIIMSFVQIDAVKAILLTVLSTFITRLSYESV